MAVTTMSAESGTTTEPAGPGGPPEGLTPVTAGNLVFVSDRGGEPAIYLTNVGTGTLKRLTTEPGNYRDPAYSPDGEKIAFARAGAGGGKYDIYVMEAGGGGATQVISGPGQDYNPAWSPDGRRIVYACEGDDPDICVADADGSGAEVITGDETVDYDPAWSPDGERIAYSTVDHIYTMTPDGGDRTRITVDSPGVERYDPEWSPTGVKVAYASNKTGRFQIHVNGATGANYGKLTGGEVDNVGPAYSPDGARIAFSSEADGGGELYVIGYDGHGLRNVAPGPGSVERQPDRQPAPASSTDEERARTIASSDGL